MDHRLKILILGIPLFSLLTWWADVWAGNTYCREGVVNGAEPLEARLLLFACSAAALAAMCYGLYTVVKTRQWVGVVVGLLIAPALYAAVAPCDYDEEYVSGFRRWAAQEIDTEVLREWTASRAEPSGSLVPVAAWPSSLLRVKPDCVIRLNDGCLILWRGGVLLERGILVIQEGNQSPGSLVSEYQPLADGVYFRVGRRP